MAFYESIKSWVIAQGLSLKAFSLQPSVYLPE